MATGQITEAISQWADELRALGGDEPLTRWRDAKVGTLDLSAADDDGRRQLVDGIPVRVSRLFPHDPLRTTAGRSARRLAERLWRLESAHGIAAGYLATGLASWNHPTSTRRPNVPILLRRLQVQSTGFGEPDLLLHVVGEPELNHRLLHEMRDQLGLRLTARDLVGPAGELRYPVVVDRLREQAPPHVVDGFSISHRAVIGLMAHEVAAVATDLADHEAAIAGRPLVSLITGTGSSAGAPPPVVDAADGAAAAIDLDADQQRVLDAVAAGGSLAVEAPAGTGATQVAAALCADAVHAGRTVLVVAEASSRLRGLSRRLSALGLGRAALDVSDGLISPAGLARDTLMTVDAAARLSPSTSPARPGGAADATLLSAYAAALHQHRPDQALSAYEAISASFAGEQETRTSVRLGTDVVAALDTATMERCRRALTDFVDSDGLSISAQVTPWFGAAPATSQDAEAAVATVDRLRTLLLPTARDTAARAAVEVGIPTPVTVADLETLTGLLSDVAVVQKVYDSAVWSAPVGRMAGALADRRSRRDAADTPGLRERRALRKQAASLRRAGASDEAAHEAMILAADVLERWESAAHDGRLPRSGEHSAVAISTWASVREALATLRAVHPSALDDDLDLPAAAARLTSLADDAVWARRLPRLGSAATELADAGLGPVVAELRARREAGVVVTAAEAVTLLDACVAASLADQTLSTDPVLSTADGDALREASQRWRQADAAACVQTADAAARAWADRVARLSAQRPAEVRALRDAASGALVTARDVAGAAWTTITTARPVLLAGPIPAAATIPIEESVDLLVVLDGQSVALAHAVGALARARQVVILADSAQPPPSPTPLVLDAPDQRFGSAPTGETPSLYAVLRDHLPSVALTTRFGCRDARLQVAAPQRRDELSLGVPPGSDAHSPLSFHHAPQEPGTRDQEQSVTTEVARVVELVREHVRGRPAESLAVLTLGSTHAEAVGAALTRACHSDPLLAEALSPDADEPVLLCALDDLVGQRRDAVILSVGYGRTMDGRLLYRYGPLNRPGGVRWLAAGVATARRRLAVVSSITASDLEPRRLAADGLRALLALLAAAEGLRLDGLDDPAAHEAVAPRPLDALGRSLAAAVHEAGMPVIPGSGSGMLAGALGLAHPGRPARGVLVIEPDGDPRASIPRLRDRDRLRPEGLMRAGWHVHRVLATDWARDPQAELERLRAAWDSACAAADALDAAANSPLPPAATTDSAKARVVDTPQPDVAVGRPVDAYPMPDLVALAAWQEATTPDLGGEEKVAHLASLLGLGHPTGRSGAPLRRAVTAAAISAAGSPTAPEEQAQDGPAGEGPTGPPMAKDEVIQHPLPGMSGADEIEQQAEKADEESERERWMEEERPPHH